MTVTTDLAPAGPISPPAWYAGVERVMLAARSFPDLPYPHTTDTCACFFLKETFSRPAAPQVLADAEETLSRMLGVTFEEDHDEVHPRWYVLSATLPGGLLVRILAWGTSVARLAGPESPPRWERLPVDDGKAVA